MKIKNLSTLKHIKKSINEIKDSTVKKFWVLRENKIKSFKLSNLQINPKKIIERNKLWLDKNFEGWELIESYINKSADWLEKNITNEKEQVFLQPSVVWAKGISWSIIGGTLFGIGWLAIAKTDEVVIATGVLEPLNGVVDVQIPINGIAKEILVKEGERVSKGQILIKLDNEINKAKLNANQESLQINQEILNGLEKLYKEGAASKFQYLQQKNKLTALKSELISNSVILKYQNLK